MRDIRLTFSNLNIELKGVIVNRLINAHILPTSLLVFTKTNCLESRI